MNVENILKAKGHSVETIRPDALVELAAHRLASKGIGALVVSADGQRLEVIPATSEVPELSELTSRQWEILSRLLRGERVATIAAALYVSRSTVRNHLGAIYRKFGVHSQLELLDRLRRRR